MTGGTAPWWMDWGFTLPLAAVTIVLFAAVSFGEQKTQREARAYEARRDRACERAFLLDCLKEAKGPTATHYTDQEDTVAQCRTVSEEVCLREVKGVTP